MNSEEIYRNRRKQANSLADCEVQKALLQISARGQGRIASTPDSTSNSEGDRFCRLTRKRLVRRRGLFAVNEPATTNRRADANGSRSLQSRNHTHYVAGSVVERNIHYPTDSGLLGDGARVLTRTMKKITELTGRAGTKLRNRMRTIGHRVMEIARTSRSKGPQVQERLKQGYRKLLTTTRKVVNQAKRFRKEIASGVKRAKDHEQKLVLQGLRKDLETMLPRVRQVIRQSRARVLGGDVHVAGKLVSIFEPSTEVIRKGKASKPTEFGKMVKIQEAENQIITHYQVFAKRPNDADLLVPAVQKHEEQFGRVPQLVAGDAGFYSASNEAELSEMGVKQISVPNRSTKSPERRRHQKKRSFRRGQKWRTGVEGRISVLKRRHGLNRCRYRGDAGMQRWVGLGVIADNLINIGRFLAANDTG